MQDGFYEKQIELRFCDCDYKKRAKLSTLMANMADIAGVAYAQKGYNHTWLWKNGYVFLVSRASMSITRMPVADECLTVTTWEREIKGVLFYRDFALKDSKGNTIVEGSTAWVLANPTTRQILRPTEFSGESHLNPDVKAKVIPPNRIKLPLEMETVGERRMVYSDIDANGHVYNAVYVAIGCDFLPAEFIGKNVTDMQINFKQEATLGETLIMKTQIDGDTAYVTGTVDAEGKPSTVSFEAMFKVK